MLWQHPLTQRGTNKEADFGSHSLLMFYSNHQYFQLFIRLSMQGLVQRSCGDFLIFWLNCLHPRFLESFCRHITLNFPTPPFPQDVSTGSSEGVELATGSCVYP
jgi:hypothetical protein